MLFASYITNSERVSHAASNAVMCKTQLRSSSLNNQVLKPQLPQSPSLVNVFM